MTVQKTCRDCGETFQGTIWKSTVERFGESAVILGTCPGCIDRYEAGLKELQERHEEVQSSAPDLDLPDTSPELAEQLGLEPREREDERDEYWK